jgi:hypothetical protein
MSSIAGAAGTDSASPTPSQLWEQYGRAVEEYRFQVNLNWQRAQYFFVLDVAVLAAAVGLRAGDSGISRAVIAALFGAGLVIATMGIFALQTQHGYYQAARDLKERFERDLALGDYALKTTPGMGSGVARRLGRVHTFQLVMMWVLLGAHGLGLGVTIAGAVPEHETTKVTVVVRVSPSTSQVVVATPRGRIVVQGRPDGGTVAFGLPTGRYEAWIARRRICRTTFVVGRQPLQTIAVRCP